MSCFNTFVNALTKRMEQEGSENVKELYFCDQILRYVR